MTAYLGSNGISSALLYIEGIRLGNAETAAILEIERGEIPPLDPLTREQLSTLLRLHGTFMLSTAEGISSIEAEERYQRRPDEEKQYRAAAIDVARSLQSRPDIIDPSAASLVLGAAEQIGQGSHPERGGVAGTGALRNVAITVTGAATIAALPVVGGLALGPSGTIAGYMAALLASEGLKASKPFGTVRSTIRNAFDGLADEEAFPKLKAKFQKHLLLIQNIEGKLRQLSRASVQFSWLSDALNWLKSRPGTEGKTEPPAEC